MLTSSAMFSPALDVMVPGLMTAITLNSGRYFPGSCIFRLNSAARVDCTRIIFVTQIETTI